jgi:hypothetical protein
MERSARRKIGVRLKLFRKVERYIPGLRFELNHDTFIPLLAARQLAIHLKGFDPEILLLFLM